MNILLTGGSGLLGTHLRRLIKCDAPGHKKLDITKSKTMKKGSYGLIIHCAAYTDVGKAESQYMRCLKINYYGTKWLREAYKDIPFVYISSEYAKHYKNYYGYTKWMGEQATKTHKPYLIIRTLFKPRPFPWKKAFTDQYTQGDYVDVIARLITERIFMWDKKKSETILVGTGRKTMFELAKQTKPDVLPCSVNDIIDVTIPKDYL